MHDPLEEDLYKAKNAVAENLKFKIRIKKR